MLRWRLLLGTLIIAALVGLCWLDAQPPCRAFGCCRWSSSPPCWPPRKCSIWRPSPECGRCDGRLSAATSCWSPCLAGIGGVSIEHCPTRVAVLTWATADHRLAQTVDAWRCLGVAVLLAVFAEMRRYRKPGGNTANIAAGVFASSTSE